MPAIYERTFRVRHYECDPYGHVNHANYVRYMQEAAFDASAAVGYDFPRYAALQRKWFVRETAITYQRPLRYGDAVTVRTWVGDFRRVRSRRMYELRHAASGELAATAVTDWVFLDGATERPVTVPEEMVAAFWPDGPPVEVPPRDRFPEPPEPPPGVFTQRRRVQWRDLDPADHVNNASYLSYFEECATGILLDCGWTMQRMQAENFGIIARNYRIEYRTPAVMHDEVDVSTWVSDLKRATAVRHYALTRVSDGELLARARALWVWVDLTTGRPLRIPAAFAESFAGNVAPQGDPAAER